MQSKDKKKKSIETLKFQTTSLFSTATRAVLLSNRFVFLSVEAQHDKCKLIAIRDWTFSSLQLGLNVQFVYMYYNTWNCITRLVIKNHALCRGFRKHACLHASSSFRTKKDAGIKKCSTYHMNQLNHCQSEANCNFLWEIRYRPDKLVVALVQEEIFDEAYLVIAAEACRDTRMDGNSITRKMLCSKIWKRFHYIPCNTDPYASTVSVGVLYLLVNLARPLGSDVANLFWKMELRA